MLFCTFFVNPQTISCTSDADCTMEEPNCINKFCSSRCNKDSQCSKGGCKAGRCKGNCKKDSDCEGSILERSSSPVCHNNWCVDCNSNKDCLKEAAYPICKDHHCTPCPTGHEFDNASKKCVPIPTKCKCTKKRVCGKKMECSGSLTQESCRWKDVNCKTVEKCGPPGCVK